MSDIQTTVQSLINRLNWHVKNFPCRVDDETGEEIFFSS